MFGVLPNKMLGSSTPSGGINYCTIRFSIYRSIFGSRLVTKVIMEEKFHLLVALTLLVTVNERNIDTYNFIGEPLKIYLLVICH